jgi:Spy/CpxP family protein refolding chaperone
MKRSILAAAAALALSAPALAGAPKLALEPAAGAGPATYRLAFAGHFWNGQQRKYQHDIALTRTAPEAFAASIDKHETQQHVDFTATRNADATLVSSNPAEQLGAYNTVARIVAAARADAAPGDGWDAKIPVSVGETASTEVPVRVTVATVTGDRTVVQATGTQTTAMTYSGFNVPVDVTVRLASLFVGGRFVRLDYEASEVIHAGPQTQTVGWTYAFEKV